MHANRSYANGPITAARGVLRVALIGGALFRLLTPALASAATSSLPQFVPGQLIVKINSDLLPVDPLGTTANALAAAQASPMSVADNVAFENLINQYQVAFVRALARPNAPANSSLMVDVQAQWSAHCTTVSQRFPTRAARASHGAPVPDLSGIYLVQVTSAATLEASAALAADPHIEYAHLNYLITAQSTPLPSVAYIPNDPYVTQDHSTWHQGAWNQTYPDLWGLQKMQAIEAWNQFSVPATQPGAGIVVAVADTGVDYLHPDIAANIWVNPGEDSNHNNAVDGHSSCPAISGDFNCRDDDGDGLIDDIRGWDFVNGDNDPLDDNGHGSHVAGTIAAVANNGVGIVGVAPHATIMPVKVLDSSGAGTCDSLVAGLVYLTDRGADVDNNSWGGPAGLCAPSLHEAIQYAYGNGVVIVDAAGNSSSDASAFEPASFLESITVSAFDENDQPTSFTNFGPAIDVAAPGGGPGSDKSDGAPIWNILSLSFANSPIETSLPHNVVSPGYLRLAGTSMAAPHVAGLAALLLSSNPYLAVEQVRQALRSSAEDVGQPGWDTASGFGRVDALATVNQLPMPVARMTNLDNNVHVFGMVPIQILAAAGLQGEHILHWSLSYRPEGSSASTIIAQGANNPPATINWNTRTLSPGSYLVEFDVDDYSSLTAVDIRRVYRSRYQDISATSLPPSLVTASTVKALDVDGDGHLDVFRCNVLSSPLDSILDPPLQELWVNDGTGTFANTPATIPQERFQCADAQVADLDGDGASDIVLVGTHQIPPAQRLWMKRGATFVDETATRLPSLTAQGIYGKVAAGDIDNDGDIDLITTDPPAILLNNGSGTFTNVTATYFPGFQACPSQSGWCDVRLVDLNGDGHLDMVYYGGTALNNGNGHFTQHQTIDWSNALIEVAGIVGTDVIVRNQFYTGDGHGGFSAPVILGTTLQIPTVVDLDFSGAADLLYTSDSLNPVAAPSVLALKNDGRGNLTPAPEERYYEPTATDARSLVANLTADQYPDILIAGGLQSSVLLKARFDEYAGCPGDCNGDNHVYINELITMVNILLGDAPLTSCLNGDADFNGVIQVSDVNVAVDSALYGCPPGVPPPAPTPKPQQVTITLGSVSGMPGANVTIPVSVSGGGGTISAMQVDLLFNSSVLTNVQCTADARLAQYSLSTGTGSEMTNPPGSARVTTALVNMSGATSFTDGHVFSCAATIKPGALAGTYGITGLRQQASDAVGSAFATTVTNGTVRVCGGCGCG